jgi:hypothetical protein
MNLLEKIKYNFDKVGYIIKLIDEWHPKKCNSEKDFEKSLYNFLHNKLTNIQITKQYALGRIKADIVVDNNIIIEIKFNLNSRNNYQRLIGQLIEYKQWEGTVIVLLIGKTDQNFIKDLKIFIQREGNTTSLEPEKFVLYEKDL